jgi:hypothetical protein
MAVGVTRVEWLGDLLAEEAIVKCKEAIDHCTKAAAEDAAANHWWSERTGDLSANTIAEPAKVTKEGTISGRFGSSMRAQGFYGLFLERKTPWLRPAADRHFHELHTILKGMMRWT